MTFHAIARMDVNSAPKIVRSFLIPSSFFPFTTRLRSNSTLRIQFSMKFPHFSKLISSPATFFMISFIRALPISSKQIKKFVFSFLSAAKLSSCSLANNQICKAASYSLVSLSLCFPLLPFAFPGASLAILSLSSVNLVYFAHLRYDQLSSAAFAPSLFTSFFLYCVAPLSLSHCCRCLCPIVLQRRLLIIDTIVVAVVVVIVIVAAVVVVVVIIIDGVVVVSTSGLFPLFHLSSLLSFCLNFCLLFVC